MQIVPRRQLVTVLAIMGMVLATSVSLAEWSTSPYVNNPVDIQPQNAFSTESVPDGSGGMLVFYSQSPDGVDPAVLLAQRVDQDGNLVWGSPIIVWESVTDNLAEFRTISDGAGGAFIAATVVFGSNARINVQHVDSNGNISWDIAGVPLVTSPTGFNMLGPAMALDDAGGIYVAWKDYFDEAITDIDIYAQRVDTAGNRLWTDAGAHVCNATGPQLDITMARDGEGGCFVVWSDFRSDPGLSIFGQHLMPNSSPTWLFNGKNLDVGSSSPTIVEGGPSGGFLLSFESSVDAANRISVSRFDANGNNVWEMFPAPIPGFSQGSGDMIPDGQGGAFVSIVDTRNPELGGFKIYLQAITPNGIARWSLAGIPAGLGFGRQYDPRMVPDGTGGVVVVWKDQRGASFSTDVYGQRISNNGARMWDDWGAPIGAGVESDNQGTVHSDGQGGFLVAWKSERNNNQYDVFAQRIGYHGKLGDANPKITAVTDYPQDQGGVVLLDWDPSYLDDLSYLEIDYYTVWSRYAGVSKNAILDGPELEVKIQQLVKETNLDPEKVRSQLKSGWTMVDQVEAFQRDSYTSFAPTHADSSDAGTPMTEFQVLAHGQTAIYWESNIMAGYSVDNLAPGAPLQLMASYLNPDGLLEWSPDTVTVPDLAGYRIYRSDTPGFTPGPTSFVASTPDTSFADLNLASGTWHYRVTAEDFNNNESGPSNEASLQTAISGVGDETPQAFRVKGAVPNPFNPSTSIHFSLDQSGQTTVEIFDTRGRLVRRLVNESMGAGSHEAVWDGRDDQGRGLPSGVYLAQVRSGAERGVTKMILAK